NAWTRGQAHRWVFGGQLLCVRRACQPVGNKRLASGLGVVRPRCRTHRVWSLGYVMLSTRDCDDKNPARWLREISKQVAATAAAKPLPQGEVNSAPEPGSHLSGGSGTALSRGPWSRNSEASDPREFCRFGRGSADPSSSNRHGSRGKRSGLNP